MILSQCVKGYVHSRGHRLFLSQKCFPQIYFRTVVSSKVRKNLLLPFGTTSSGLNDIAVSTSRDNILRNAEEIKLRDFLNCFYVSGWLPLHLMKDCIDSICSTEPWNDELSSILLRCCGRILATCDSNVRINVSNTVWKHVTKATNVSHDQFHILLNVDAENSYYRPDILSDMENRNLKPNQTTYHLLLQSASESNSEPVFNQLKSTMERNNIDLNENFYSSLLRLYTLNKNVKGIEEVEAMVQSADSKFTIITLFALMRAYASLGKFDTLLESMEQTSSLGLQPKSNQIAQIIAELAQFGYSYKIVQFVRHIHSLGLRMTIKDINWVTAFLASRHFEKIAYELLSKISWEEIVLDVQMDLPPATLASVMAAHWSAEKNGNMMEILRSMEEKVSFPWAMEAALHGALRQSNAASAWAIIEDMRKRAKPLRSQYFWPLLVGASSPKEILDVTKRMVDLGVQPDTTTLKTFIFERLLPRGIDPVYLEERLLIIGLQARQLILPLDIYFLENNMMDVALERASRPNFEGSTELVEALKNAYLRTHDDQSMMKFLRILQSDKVTKTDWVGQAVVEVYNENPVLGERLLENLESSGLGLSADLVVLIRAFREEAKLGSFEDCERLKGQKETQSWPRVFSGKCLHPSQMNVNELENHLVELRAKRMGYRGILRKLFMMHVNKRNTTRANEILQELKRYTNEWSPAMLSSKMQLHAILEQPDEALETYTKLKTKHPKFRIDTYRVMAVAECLFKAGRSRDAFDIILELPNGPGIRNTTITSFLVPIQVVSQKGRTQDVHKLIDILIGKKLVPPSNPVLGHCVRHFLLRNDIEGAVNEFQSLNKKYGLLPYKFELLTALHAGRLKGTLKDFDKLKTTVTDILKNHSTYHPLDELLPAAHAQDKQEVTLILSDMIKNRRWKHFDRQCRSWAVTNNVIPLELILSDVLELQATNLNMSCVIYALADYYYYEGNSNKLSQIFQLIMENKIYVTAEVRRSVDKLSRTCGLSDKEPWQKHVELIS